MSFHFRLSSSSSSSSSSEDEEGDEENIVPMTTIVDNNNGHRKDPKTTTTTTTATFATSTNTPATSSNQTDANPSQEKDEEEYSSADESDDDDGIEWEDAVSYEEGGPAEEENDDNDGTTPTTSTMTTRKRSLPTRDITIDFGGSDEDDESEQPAKKKGRKTRRVNKIQNLPPDVEALLLAIHRSHMLTLTSRALFVSSTCSDWELLNVAHSFIPSQMLDDLGNRGDKKRTKLPEENDARRLCTWYFDMVNNATERIRRRREDNIAAGAPQIRNLRGRTTSASARRRRGGTRGRGRAKGGVVSDGIKSDSLSNSSGGRKRGRHVEEGIGVTNPCRLMNIFNLLSSTRDENPQYQDDSFMDRISDITSHEKAQLLVVILRSLGWRARYVLALKPVGRDLTVDHPLLTTNVKDIFQFIYNSSKYEDTTKKKCQKTSKGKKSKSTTSDMGIIDLVDSEDDNEQKNSKPNSGTPNSSNKTTKTAFMRSELGWVEILCHPNNQQKPSLPRQRRGSKPSIASKKSHAPRWIHIDPQRESFDQPQTMESVLFSLQFDGDGSTKKEQKRVNKGMVNMSYVLAVEHPMASNHVDGSNATELYNLSDCNNNPHNSVVSSKARLRAARITDVTPRYANAWSKTLRLRGATGVQVASGRGKCVDLWWVETIRKSNRLFRRLARCNISRTKGKLREFGQKKKVKIRNNPEFAQENVAKKKPELFSSTRQHTMQSFENEGVCVSKDNLSCSLQGATAYDRQSSDEDRESDMEKNELQLSTEQESIPTSKAAFKKHPLYVIPTVMLVNEVLAPDAHKRVCGVFKGQLVYKRSDVSTALAAKKWLYKGRKVKDEEIRKPAKTVKARKKPTSTSFKELESYGVSANEQSLKDIEQKRSSSDTVLDGKERLYGIWQTEAWSPKPVAPHEDIPVNEYKNVELALLNPGLVHLDQRGMSIVARKLGIPYAPCLMGFEGHGGNRTPTIRGVVVHAHNADLLKEAFTEWESQNIEQEYKKRQTEIHQRWKRLVIGLLTKDRLEREYGEEN